MMANAAAIYLIIVLGMSLICFFTYGFDKSRAINGGRRVSEAALQMLAFFGGWPGALIGQRCFHHKTKKVKFLIVFWFVVALHLGVVGFIAYALVTSDKL